MYEDAGVEEEVRDAAIGMDFAFRLLFMRSEEAECIESCRLDSPNRGRGDVMKSLNEKIAGRLRKSRPMTTISFRIPEDLIEDLKELAPLRGFGGYQPLIRSYIGEGMRRDEALLAQPEIKVIGETLRKHGIPDEVISEVIAETLQKSA